LGGHEADALAGTALVQLLNEQGLAASMARADENSPEPTAPERPAVVCLSLMPPLTMAHARAVYQPRAIPMRR